MAVRTTESGITFFFKIKLYSIFVKLFIIFLLNILIKITKNFWLILKSKHEKVSIIGLNSWGQSLHLNIDWRPQTSNTSAIDIGFNIEDGKGNTYYMNEQNLVSFDKNKRQYKAPGISLEVLNPFRRLRIKFRGYLTKKGTNELVFVKIRLLWIAISNVFDFECHHNKNFIEQEWQNSKIKKSKHIAFENRFEQLGQMKGTIQFDDQNEEKLFLWGNKSKKYEQKNICRKVFRLFGYSKVKSN